MALQRCLKGYDVHLLHSKHHQQTLVTRNYSAACLNSSANLNAGFKTYSAFKVSHPNRVLSKLLARELQNDSAQSHDAGGKMTFHGNKAHCILKQTQDQLCFHTKRLSSGGFNIQNGSDIWAEHQLSGWEGASEQ